MLRAYIQELRLQQLQRDSQIEKEQIQLLEMRKKKLELEREISVLESTRQSSDENGMLKMGVYYISNNYSVCYCVMLHDIKDYKLSYMLLFVQKMWKKMKKNKRKKKKVMDETCSILITIIMNASEPVLCANGGTYWDP